MALLERMRRRARAPIVAAAALCLTGSPAQSWIAEAAAVVGAIVNVAGAFAPKGGGTTQILIAISQNIAAINQSLQALTSDVAQLKQDVRELPDRILEHQMVVQIAGRLQENFLSLQVLAEMPSGAARESSYRDVRRYYDMARDLRADLFSNEMGIAERLALQIPLLYGVEASAFDALNGIDLEDPQNAPNFPYYVHKKLWLSALNDYARFYRWSLDENTGGTFANKLVATEQEITNIFATIPSDFSEELKSNRVILTARMCYYSTHEDRVEVGQEMDDRGLRIEYEDVTYYTFDKQTYVFEKDDKGEVFSVQTWGEHLADYDTLHVGSPLDLFQSDFGEQCDIVVPAGQFDQQKILASDHVKRLEYLFASRNLLRQLKILNEKMAEVIEEELKIRGVSDPSQIEGGGLRFPVKYLGEQVLQ